ncbi:hypothetical protein D9M70_649160 [compost metagenome]
MGIGRIGAIIGPLLGGALHAAQLPLQASFLAFALPGLVGAAAILVFLWQRSAAGGLVTEKAVEPTAG